ncbi:hypothetical protein FQN49_006505 [Arthroderma sp. PD_2]|nr:hypothetical protein FQN49_006505 [Arthroderma sp. PD_2]
MAVQVFNRIKLLRDSLNDKQSRSASPSPRLSPTIRSLGNSGGNMATTSENPVERGVSNVDNTSEIKGITFANQDSLPKLPIPDLESTCAKYLETLAPLQSTSEHEATKAAVNEFMAAEGPELQEKLKKYATSKV